MKTIRTRSGAVYLYDDEEGWLKRVSGKTGNHMSLPNGVWFAVQRAHAVEVGRFASFQLENEQRLITTVIEEITDED